VLEPDAYAAAARAARLAVTAPEGDDARLVPLPAP